MVVFVAGQAGSGKTLVMDLVHAALGQRGGAVRGGDGYKAPHPHYSTFLAEDVRTAGVRVRPETYRWQAEVEAHPRGRRFDVVAEEALANPAGWLATLAVYRAAGCRVEVVALAVPEAVSQLGVLDRYLRLAHTASRAAPAYAPSGSLRQPHPRDSGGATAWVPRDGLLTPRAAQVPAHSTRCRVRWPTP